MQDVLRTASSWCHAVPTFGRVTDSNARVGVSRVYGGNQGAAVNIEKYS
jgi:hypothetical protein